jgi:hypothetical protein
MATKRLFLAVPLVLMILLAIGFIPQWVPSAPAQSAGQAADTQGITIPYPGRLTDPAGQPVSDGAYDFTFALYAAERGGEALWTETQTGVAVQGGNFSVLLGRAVPIPKQVAERAELWLEVAVRGPAESAFTTLDARQRIRSFASSPDLQSSCAHDHMGEWWVGSSGSAGLIVDNRTGTGDGVRGYATVSSSNYGGVYGVNFAAGPGVYGRSDGGGPGVAGYSSGRGVYGNGADGVVGESSIDGMSGVYGVNAATGYGVTGRAGSYFGVLAWGNDAGAYDKVGDLLLAGSLGEIFTYGDLLDIYSNDRVVVDLDDDDNTTGAFFRILDGADGILWTVSETAGDVVAAGTQASVAKTADHGQRLLYAVEGTGVWVEDVGTATLVEGELTVAYDPIFAQTVNLQQDYQVFVTALSDQPVLLYVSAKTPTGFTVRGVTLDGKPASCSFDYRIVAQRLGYEGTRLQENAPVGDPKVDP